MAAKKSDDYEERQRELDPHRTEEQRKASAEAAGRLRSRGIVVSETEPLEAIGDLLEAVERFENVVEAHGGDLMVDDLKSSEPDDRHFVLPRRNKGEAIRAYISRIDEKTDNLRKHPPRKD